MEQTPLGSTWALLTSAFAGVKSAFRRSSVAGLLCTISGSGSAGLRVRGLLTASWDRRWRDLLESYCVIHVRARARRILDVRARRRLQDRIRQYRTAVPRG